MHLKVKAEGQNVINFYANTSRVRSNAHL